jgi:hypothetical protein
LNHCVCGREGGGGESDEKERERGERGRSAKSFDEDERGEGNLHFFLPLTLLSKLSLSLFCSSFSPCSSTAASCSPSGYQQGHHHHVEQGGLIAVSFFSPFGGVRHNTSPANRSFLSCCCCCCFSVVLILLSSPSFSPLPSTDIALQAVPPSSRSTFRRHKRMH